LKKTFQKVGGHKLTCTKCGKVAFNYEQFYADLDSTECYCPPCMRAKNRADQGLPSEVMTDKEIVARFIHKDDGLEDILPKFRLLDK
jgi:hypothetical protein